MNERFSVPDTSSTTSFHHHFGHPRPLTPPSSTNNSGKNIEVNMPHTSNFQATGEDQECASFLMTLKYRSVTPELFDDSSNNSKTITPMTKKDLNLQHPDTMPSSPPSVPSAPFVSSESTSFTQAFHEKQAKSTVSEFYSHRHNSYVNSGTTHSRNNYGGLLQTAQMGLNSLQKAKNDIGSTGPYGTLSTHGAITTEDVFGSRSGNENDLSMAVDNDAKDDVNRDEEEYVILESGIPLARPEDDQWLSDLQCYVRLHCVEFFCASTTDGASSSNSPKRSSSSASGSGSQGRRKPISCGRVGIRCVFCKDIVVDSSLKKSKQKKRACQATSFPSKISGIYSATVMMQCRHFPFCHMMPESVRETLASIKRDGTSAPSLTSSSPPATSQSGSSSWSFVGSGNGGGGGAPGRQQYWAASAKKIGLVDTEDGIRFSSLSLSALHPHLTKPPKTIPKAASKVITAKVTPSQEDKQDSTNEIAKSAPCLSSSVSLSSSSSLPESSRLDDKFDAPTNSKEKLQSHEITPELTPSKQSNPISPQHLSLPSTLDSLLCKSTLVNPEDRHLVPDHLFLAMAQMKPCKLSDVDRIGCYKSRPIGFIGMCCKHCGGRPGFGKYFPASVRSLAQTTTSQTIVKHVGMKCRHVPEDVREAVMSLQKYDTNNMVSSNSNSSAVAKVQQDGDSGSGTEVRPKYGSRKIFFRRVWGRLQIEDKKEVKENREDDTNRDRNDHRDTDVHALNNATANRGGMQNPLVKRATDRQISRQQYGFDQQQHHYTESSEDDKDESGESDCNYPHNSISSESSDDSSTTISDNEESAELFDNQNRRIKICSGAGELVLDRKQKSKNGFGPQMIHPVTKQKKRSKNKKRDVAACSVVAAKTENILSVTGEPSFQNTSSMKYFAPSSLSFPKTKRMFSSCSVNERKKRRKNHHHLV